MNYNKYNSELTKLMKRYEFSYSNFINPKFALVA